MKKIYDILIIGGGSAGITAGIYAKRAGRDVAIIEMYALGGQLNILGKIENYTGFPSIEGPDLAIKFSDHAKSLSVPVFIKEAIAYKLDGEIKEVICKKESFFARSIIFAMGSFSRELGIEGEKEFNGRGVSYCAVCDGNFFKDKTVAVAGSGDSAFCDAQYLSGLCNHVYLLTKENLKLHNYAENQFDNVENVTLLKGALTKKIEGDESVKSVTYEKDGKEEILVVDGVFVAIGRTPETSALKGLIDLDARGYIITDQNMQSSCPGVYACGDVRSNTIKQISTAVGDGAIAATEATKYVLRQLAKNRK